MGDSTQAHNTYMQPNVASPTATATATAIVAACQQLTLLPSVLVLVLGSHLSTDQVRTPSGSWLAQYTGLESSSFFEPISRSFLLCGTPCHAQRRSHTRDLPYRTHPLPPPSWRAPHADQKQGHIIDGSNGCHKSVNAVLRHIWERQCGLAWDLTGI